MRETISKQTNKNKQICKNFKNCSVSWVTVIFLIFLILDPPVNQACHEDKVECQSMAFLVDFDCPSFRALCVLTKVSKLCTIFCKFPLLRILFLVIWKLAKELAKSGLMIEFCKVTWQICGSNEGLAEFRRLKLTELDSTLAEIDKKIWRNT